MLLWFCILRVDQTCKRRRRLSCPRVASTANAWTWERAKGRIASRFAVTVETVESVEATHGPERRRRLLHVWSTRRAKSNVKLYYCTLVSQAPLPNIFFYLLIHYILVIIQGVPYYNAISKLPFFI